MRKLILLAAITLAGAGCGGGSGHGIDTSSSTTTSSTTSSSTTTSSVPKAGASTPVGTVPAYDSAECKRERLDPNHDQPGWWEQCFTR